MEEMLKYIPVIYVLAGLILGIWLAYPITIGSKIEGKEKQYSPPIEKQI
jgi:hypothetical protein